MFGRQPQLFEWRGRETLLGLSRLKEPSRAIITFTLIEGEERQNIKNDLVF